MADGISYLRAVTAMQASEADAEQAQAVSAPTEASARNVGGDLSRAVQTFIDDLQRAARADRREGRLVDAAIEKFCNEQFALNEAKGNQAESLLKVAVHSAMEGGLTRNEVLAAISQTGSAVKSGGPLPAELYLQAGQIVGSETHLAMGIAQFMGEMDGANKPVPAADERINVRNDDLSAGFTRGFLR